MKKIMIVIVLGVLFFGCSDKEDSKKSVAKKSIESGQIEVVENSSYKEHKKEELESKGIVTGAKGDSFYYDYDKKDGTKKEKVTKEEKSYTPFDANMRVRSPYENLEISLLVSKLSKNFIVKCSACHNDYANGIIGPSLIGKDKEFIYNSIMDFKSAKKKNVLMDDLIHLMSNDEIEILAQEISDFNKKIKELREQKK